MKTKNYAGVDLFRIPAALMVAAIHIAPFSTWNRVGDVLFTYCLGRIAVPFFLMTTGFFVLAPYAKSGFRDKRRLVRFLRQNTLLYLAATLFYFPINWYAGNLPKSVPEFLKALLFDGTFYHLWYFPAVILGCLLVAILAKRSMRAGWIYAGIAYLIGLAGDSYYGLIQQIPALKACYDGIFSISNYTRNGIFFAPIYLLLGMAIANPRNRCSKTACRWGLPISVVFLLIEGYLTDLLHLQRHNSMYLFLLPVLYFLFQMLLRIPGQAPRWVHGGCTLFYLIHPAVIVLVRGAAKITGTTKLFVENSMIHYSAVCVVSLGLVAAVLFLKERRNAVCAKKVGPGSS